MAIVLEYIIVFIFIFVINYLMRIRNNVKYKKKNIPNELLYLKKIYNINVNKGNYKQFIYICCITNTFIITTIYIILIYLIEGWILKIILGIILLILMIIICYGLLGRYFSKKEGNKNV